MAISVGKFKKEREIKTEKIRKCILTFLKKNKNKAYSLTEIKNMLKIPAGSAYYMLTKLVESKELETKRIIGRQRRYYRFKGKKRKGEK